MSDVTRKAQFGQDVNGWSALEQIAREGAGKMIQLALENEVQEYIAFHSNQVDDNGRKIVVKNGYLTERDILTGIGALKLKQPRVRTRGFNSKSSTEPFSSKILPRYLRRIPSIDNLISVLYLKGISTNDFSNISICHSWRRSKGTLSCKYYNTPRNSYNKKCNSYSHSLQ